MHEMLTPWVIAAALFLLHLGLRGIWHPWAQQGQNASFLGAIFAMGYGVGRTAYWGAVFIVLWFAWIIGRYLRGARQWRTVIEIDIQPCRAPNRYRFPPLEELTESLAELGFEEQDDLGAGEEGACVFLRRFQHAEERSQAVIVFQEHGDFAFCYVSFTTFIASGERWVTWNNPVNDVLLLPPEIHLQQVAGTADDSVAQMVEAHRAFFAASGQEAAPLPTGCGRERTMAEMRRYISYNMEQGILQPAEQEGTVRYTWRGVWLALKRMWR